MVTTFVEFSLVRLENQLLSNKCSRNQNERVFIKILYILISNLREFQFGAVCSPN